MQVCIGTIKINKLCVHGAQNGEGEGEEEMAGTEVAEAVVTGKCNGITTWLLHYQYFSLQGKN